MKRRIFIKKSRNKADAEWNPAFYMAVGFAAIFSVCVLGYFKFFASFDERSGSIPIEASISSERQAILSGIEEKLPVAVQSMRVPALNEMLGTWFVRYGETGIAEVILTKGAFQLVTTEDRAGRLRKYSRGTISYDAQRGVLSLIPTQKAGAPKEISGVLYRILTMRPYDVFVKIAPDDDSLYFTASSDQILSKNAHPLFSKADYSGAPVLKFTPVRKPDAP